MKQLVVSAVILLAAAAAVSLAIFALSVLTFLLVTALKLALFATAVYLVVRLGKHIFRRFSSAS